MNGSSVLMANSHIDLDAKTLNLSLLPGIWEFARIGGEEILSACMIVGQPNPLVSGVHDRMPVMLLADDYDRWLDPGAQTSELLALLRPYDAKLMEAYAVNRAVNSVKNDNESCIESIGVPARL